MSKPLPNDPMTIFDEIGPLGDDQLLAVIKTYLLTDDQEVKLNEAGIDLMAMLNGLELDGPAKVSLVHELFRDWNKKLGKTVFSLFIGA